MIGVRFGRVTLGADEHDEKLAAFAAMLLLEASAVLLTLSTSPSSDGAQLSSRVAIVFLEDETTPARAELVATVAA